MSTCDMISVRVTICVWIVHVNMYEYISQALCYVVEVGLLGVCVCNVEYTGKS